MLPWYFILFFSRDYVPFHIVSLDGEYLLHMHVASGSYFLHCNDNNIFGGGGGAGQGKLGILRGECSTPQIP